MDAQGVRQVNCSAQVQPQACTKGSRQRRASCGQDSWRDACLRLACTGIGGAKLFTNAYEARPGYGNVRSICSSQPQGTHGSFRPRTEIGLCPGICFVSIPPRRFSKSLGDHARRRDGLPPRAMTRERRDSIVNPMAIRTPHTLAPRGQSTQCPFRNLRPFVDPGRLTPWRVDFPVRYDATAARI